MKIPAAKAAVDKEWEKLEKIPAWDLKEVIDEARTKGAKVHFASLMDICHLKNGELEAKHQEYKGRVVLRGDFVKDDPGSHAVFHRARIVSVPNDSSKKSWISYPDCQGAQDKQRMQYLLIRRSKWKMHQSNFQSQNVKQWMSLQDCLVAMDKQQTQYRLTPR